MAMFNVYVLTVIGSVHLNKAALSPSTIRELKKIHHSIFIFCLFICHLIF